MNQQDEMCRIITVAHSEDVATAFPGWPRLAYDGEFYTPYDLNMPSVIPNRSRNHMKSDPPLTVHGETIAKLVGKEMRDFGFRPNVIYSGPEYRSVQTATNIASLLPISTVVCIEPALASWAGLAVKDVQKIWLTPAQFSELGFSVNMCYEPLMKNAVFRGYDAHETARDYYNRLMLFYSHISTAITDKQIVVVTDPVAVPLTRNLGWNTPDELIALRIGVKHCEHHTIGVNKSYVAHPVKGLLRPFTRTLAQAMEERK